MSATPTTVGTNHAATLSASACIGARDRRAAATMSMICAKTVAAPTRSARITSVPDPFSVPPVRAAASVFSTGSASPVSRLSSTEDAPSTTSPSTGTLSPARTRCASHSRKPLIPMNTTATSRPTVRVAGTCASFRPTGHPISNNPAMIK